MNEFYLVLRSVEHIRVLKIFFSRTHSTYVKFDAKIDVPTFLTYLRFFNEFENDPKNFSNPPNRLSGAGNPNMLKKLESEEIFIVTLQLVLTLSKNRKKTLKKFSIVPRRAPGGMVGTKILNYHMPNIKLSVKCHLKFFEKMESDSETVLRPPPSKASVKVVRTEIL